MAPYDEGLAYPEWETPDHWDFIHYSLAIAMCYQTSDLRITTTAVRRVTLLFFFVAAVIGLVVNILSRYLTVAKC